MRSTPKKRASSALAAGYRPLSQPPNILEDYHTLTRSRRPAGVLKFPLPGVEKLLAVGAHPDVPMKRARERRRSSTPAGRWHRFDREAVRRSAPQSPGLGSELERFGFIPARNSPEAEAGNLLRSQLVSEVRDIAKGLTQAQAAKRLGVSQSRVNDLLRGKIDKMLGFGRR